MTIFKPSNVCSTAVPSKIPTKVHAVYDKLTRSDVMWQAWINVATNQGAPGVDGVSIDAIKAGGYEGVMSFLDELSAEVRPRPIGPNHCAEWISLRPGSLVRPDHSAYPVCATGC